MVDHPSRRTRRELYELVWTTPAYKLGPELGLSGRGLAKLCARQGIPVPSRGYWAKLRHGKEVDRTPLPDVWPTAPRLAAPDTTGQAAAHPLFKDAQQLFEAGRVTDNGYLQPRKRLLPDIFVSKNTLSRAIETMNQLFLKLEQAGHPVVIAPNGSRFHRPEVDEREKGGKERFGSYTWRPGRPTVTFVENVALGLTLFELSRRVEGRYIDGEWTPVAKAARSRRKPVGGYHDWTSWRDLPTGRFVLRACSPHPYTRWQQQWSSDKAGNLKQRFRAIMKVLEREAPRVARLAEEGRKEEELAKERWEAQQREWRREQAERRRRELEQQSLQELFTIIEAWGQARRVEEFFRDVERRAVNLDGQERDAVLERIGLARKLLGGVDALKRLGEWKPPDPR